MAHASRHDGVIGIVLFLVCCALVADNADAAPGGSAATAAARRVSSSSVENARLTSVLRPLSYEGESSAAPGTAYLAQPQRFLRKTGYLHSAAPAGAPRRRTTVQLNAIATRFVGHPVEYRSYPTDLMWMSGKWLFGYSGMVGRSQKADIVTLYPGLLRSLQSNKPSPTAVFAFAHSIATGVAFVKADSYTNTRLFAMSWMRRHAKQIVAALGIRGRDAQQTIYFLNRQVSP